MVGCGTFRGASVKSTQIPYREVVQRAGHYALAQQRVSIHKTGRKAEYVFWKQACWFDGYRYWLVLTMDHQMNCILKVSAYADTALLPGYNIQKLLRNDYWKSVQQSAAPLPPAPQTGPSEGAR
jgi:hypothetical protein